MNDHTLAAEYINAGYNHKTILSDVSVTIPKNKMFLKFHPDKWQKCSAFCRSHLLYRRESR